MTEPWEMSGVYASAGDKKGWVRLDERSPSRIDIVITVALEPVGLTPIEARRLARQLNRFARRAEQRGQA